MINNVGLVPAVQQSDSVIHIDVSILFQILFPIRLLHNIEQSSLCYTVGPCWLSILNTAVCTCQFWVKSIKLQNMGGPHLINWRPNSKDWSYQKKKFTSKPQQQLLPELAACLTDCSLSSPHNCMNLFLLSVSLSCSLLCLCVYTYVWVCVCVYSPGSVSLENPANTTGNVESVAERLAWCLWKPHSSFRWFSQDWAYSMCAISVAYLRCLNIWNGLRSVCWLWSVLLQKRRSCYEKMELDGWLLGVLQTILRVVTLSYVK